MYKIKSVNYRFTKKKKPLASLGDLRQASTLFPSSTIILLDKIVLWLELVESRRQRHNRGRQSRALFLCFCQGKGRKVKVSSHKMQQGSSGALSMQSSGWVMKSPRLLWCAFASSWFDLIELASTVCHAGKGKVTLFKQGTADQMWIMVHFSP